MLKILVSSGFFALLLTACSSYEATPEAQIPELTAAEKSRLSADSLLLELYMAEQGLDANYLDEAGVFILIENLGEGSDRPNINSTLTLQFAFRNLENQLLENEENAVFQLKNEILGWQVGLPYFRKGGKGILFIPSYLAERDEAVICNIEILDFE